jgi:Protein  of unknown function (DUF3018)
MAKTAAEKTADYRKRMRAKGYRQIQLWVPDLSSPEMREELRREAELLRDHPSTREGDEFVEAALADLTEELDAIEEDADGKDCR